MSVIKTVNLKKLGKKYQGKTRDFYIRNSKRIIISTDRISAFDIILDHIPHKGQVLNLLSLFWFNKTKDIIPNHLISSPDPNVMVVKNAKLVPIEMVVRGYITGVTGTSIWGSYEKGERTIYGLRFKNGLRKNQKLPKPIITPTTKAEKGHDERLTEKEIIEKKIVSKKIWKQMKKAALKLFERGNKICEKAGIILVDTKYEFGIYNNKLILIDEIHTPDSSRFWVKNTYKQRFSKGLEPENFDKEFMRIWFAKKGYKGHGKAPKMPRDFVKKISKRYISIYKKITRQKFVKAKNNITERISNNLGSLSL